MLNREDVLKYKDEIMEYLKKQKELALIRLGESIVFSCNTENEVKFWNEFFMIKYCKEHSTCDWVYKYVKQRTFFDILYEDFHKMSYQTVKFIKAFLFNSPDLLDFNYKCDNGYVHPVFKTFSDYERFMDLLGYSNIRYKLPFYWDLRYIFLCELERGLKELEKYGKNANTVNIQQLLSNDEIEDLIRFLKEEETNKSFIDKIKSILI